MLIIMERFTLSAVLFCLFGGYFSHQPPLFGVEIVIKVTCFVLFIVSVFPIAVKNRFVLEFNLKFNDKTPQGLYTSPVSFIHRTCSEVNE